MTKIEKLRSEYEQAEQRAQKLMADKDEAIQNVRDRFAGKLQAANDKATQAQKALNDAEAAAALVGRDDAERVADALGLTLPE